MSFPTAIQRPVVLFDLDGTLLPMKMTDFTDVYFQTIAEVLPQLPPQETVRVLMAGIRAMVQNDGSRTNQAVFAEVFHRESGIPFAEAEPLFQHYYETGFQRCRDICHPTPLSREIVTTLQNKGYTVAIATNPVFPHIATFSRLQWAGLDGLEFPLVTTFENSGSAKPNPRYFQLVCDRLGVSPADCLLVGNDVREDGAATALGMPVLLVTDYLFNPKGLPTEGFPMGSLEELAQWASALPVSAGV